MPGPTPTGPTVPTRPPNSRLCIAGATPYHPSVLILRLPSLSSLDNVGHVGRMPGKPGIRHIFSQDRWASGPGPRAVLHSMRWRTLASPRPMWHRRHRRYHAHSLIDQPLINRDKETDRPTNLARLQCRQMRHHLTMWTWTAWTPTILVYCRHSETIRNSCWHYRQNWD